MRIPSSLALLVSGCCFAPAMGDPEPLPPSPAVIEAPSAPPIARVAISDPVIAVVSGIGVVRYDGERFERVLETGEHVSDVALGPSGEIHVALGGAVRVVDGATPRELPPPAPGVAIGRIEIAPTGAIVATTDTAFARFEDGQWTITRLDGVVREPWQLDTMALRGLALDRTFRGVAYAVDDVFEEGRFGARRAHVRDRADEHFVGIAWSWDDVVVIQDHHVYRWDASAQWTHVDHPLGDLALRSVAVGTDGTIVVGAIGEVAIIPRAGEVRSVALASIGSRADWVSALARDAEGRIWLGSHRTLSVLSPELALVAEWTGARVPELAGDVEQLAIRMHP